MTDETPEAARTFGEALNDLGVTFVDNLAIALPMLMGVAVVPFVLAWFKKRTRQLVAFVEAEAVQAEKDFTGDKQGIQKHAQVKTRAVRKFGATISGAKLDDLITTQGRDVGNAYRASLPPKEPT